MLWIGVDVGGTFTDLVVYDTNSRQTRIEKVSSTSQNQAIGILNGISALAIKLRDVERMIHGSTVATNVAVERNGARVWVFTTRGFKDVLEVGRGERIKMYDSRSGREPPLVPRSAVFEVSERINAEGQVVFPLDLTNLSDGLADRHAPDAMAVCGLHSYRNADHEERLAAYLRERFPDTFVTSSADVLREPREYERFATAVLNAYVAPAMRAYLSSLVSRLSAGGFDGTLQIMTSNGGAASVERVMAVPVSTIMSGPAAGVTGTLYWTAHCGLGNVITFDMGGTSTDTCLIKDGAVSMSGETRICGLVSRLPQIEINSVGSGGGSIARVGAGRFLTVGPESAGSSPGPACYGRGGLEATLTDANVVVGRIGTEDGLGRDIRLSKVAAQEAVNRLAIQLGIGLNEMAEGIIRVAVAKTTGAIREISIMRGHDTREFTLFAFGGAGPLHAALVADVLESPRVVIPPYPGAFSAFGLLTADNRVERRRPMEHPLSGLSSEYLRSCADELTHECEVILRAGGGGDQRITYTTRIDLRYNRQASHLTIQPRENEALDPAELAELFTREYARQFGHSQSDPIEVCGLSVAAAKAMGRPEPAPVVPGRLEEALVGSRAVIFDAAPFVTPVYARARLPVDEIIVGPCIIEEYGATSLVPPHYNCRTDIFGNLILERRK